MEWSGSEMPAINRPHYSTVIKDFKNVIGRHILPRNVLLLLMLMRFQEMDPHKHRCEDLKPRVYVDFSHLV